MLGPSVLRNADKGPQVGAEPESSLEEESSPLPSLGSTTSSWTTQALLGPRRSASLLCPRAAGLQSPLLGSEFGSEKQTDKRTASLARLLAELSPQGAEASSYSPGPCPPRSGKGPCTEHLGA